MSGKRVSEFGKRVSEDEMSTVALREALTWHDELMDKLHRGRGDKEKRVRGELSDESGIPESYLFRLQHKRRDMRDIAGEAYRRLAVTYDRICQRNEEAADRNDAERLAMRKTYAVDQKPASARHFEGEARD